jgi:hypothetical protein
MLLILDIISLNAAESSPSTVSLDEENIAWPSDKYKYAQPDGFKYKKVATSNVTCTDYNLPDSCKYYYDNTTSQGYLYYYPNDDEIQYLYESYPDLISPIIGVLDEHFQVWMRPAALPRFRKLYGKIDRDFEKGDYLSFTIIANYEVNSFDAEKSIVISTVGEFGGQNPYLGVAYIVVGALALLFGALFAAKQLIAPRRYADIALLHWD